MVALVTPLWQLLTKDTLRTESGQYVVFDCVKVDFVVIMNIGKYKIKTRA